jgi:pimeloyl-ACP methyl ester carboxylesterase
MLTHKRATANGVRLHYVTAGKGPVILCMHGWPQNHREFLPVIEAFRDKYRFIAPDLRGYADSDKPFDGYEPKTIAADMLDLLAVEGVDKFHILSHDLGGPPSVALAYMSKGRATSLATIETPFFGLDFPGYVDPRVPYWHLAMHMNMDVTRFLVEGREEQYLRHFFRDFAYNPSAVPEEEVQQYVDTDAPAWQSARQSQPLRLHTANGGANQRTHEVHANCADACVGGTGFVRRSLLRLRESHRRVGQRRCDRRVRPLGIRREDLIHQ